MNPADELTSYLRQLTALGVVLAAILLVWPATTAAQATYNDQSARGGASPESVKDIAIQAGATFFSNPAFDTVVLVEFPFTLNRSDFEFFRPDSADPRFFARIFAQLNVFGVDGRPIDSTNTYFSAAVSDLAEASIPDVKLFNALALAMKPGVYSATLTVIDAKSKVEGAFTYSRIVVEPAEKDRLSISGKCLAYDISYVGSDPSTDNNRLVKNGFHVLCNPLGVYGLEDSSLCLYAEVYNLDFGSGDTSAYKVGYAFVDEFDEVIQDFGYRLRQKPGSTVVVTDCFDISDLGLGIYQLRILAADFKSGQSDTEHVTFRILGPETFAGQSGSSEDQWEPFDTLSLEVKIEITHYMLTPVERKTLRGLTDEGKENYIEQFWRENDLNPRTAIVESRNEMFQRYLYCNALFSTNVDRDDGWRGDRGRIYMTNGRWDERDDIQAPRTGQPFQVWYYHSIGEGAIFVFEDKNGVGDYRLVHSNVEGEVYSSDWQRMLDEGLYLIN